MDRKQVKEILPILVAFAKGKTIETRRKPTADNNGVTKDGWYEFNDWTEMKELEYWVNVDYRIKPEPKYRPFANAEECWAEMLKHQPFGWVKKKDTQSFLLCKTVGKFTSAGMENSPYTYDDAFEFCTFADDAPFGVKEE